MKGCSATSVLVCLTLAAHSQTQPVVNWDVSHANVVSSSPTVVDGSVYVGCWDGNVYALDAATGVRRWDHDTKGQYSLKRKEKKESCMRLVCLALSFRYATLCGLIGLACWPSNP